MNLFGRSKKKFTDPEDDKYEPVEYRGHGLWRCRDGCLRDKHGVLHDVGPFEYFLRVPVPGTERLRINLGESTDSCPGHGFGEFLPGTEQKATKTDTNLPPKGRIFDESLDLLEVSWCMQFDPEQLTTVQRFLDRAVFEFYIGGEKPFYQCNMAAMARWEPYAARGSFVLPEAIRLRSIEKRWLELHFENVTAVPDLFVIMHCRRYRGVC